MKRLAQVNINTQDYFDQVWAKEGIHYFDKVRLEKFLEFIDEGDRVLDVGAGMYSFAEYALSLGMEFDAYAIDFSEYAREKVLSKFPKMDYRVGDVLKLPWPDEYFDVVGAGEVIEHMEDPVAFLAEMARVTRNYGVVMLSTVDTSSDDAIAHGPYPEHLWEFDGGELVSLMEIYGITNYELVGDYHFLYCLKAPKWWEDISQYDSLNA